MTRVVRPSLSVDQVRALIEAAEDRTFKMALVLMMHPQAGNRDPILLAGAVARLKEALAESGPASSILGIRGTRRSD